MEHQSSHRPPPPPRNEINHIRHVRKLEEEESLKKKNNNNKQEKSFLENVFSNIFRSESIDEERENGEEERGRREGEDEENKKNTKNANKQQQQQQKRRRTRQQKRREGEVNIDIDIENNNNNDGDAVANRTPPKSHEEKYQREDIKEDGEEEDTESKFSERLRNASGSAKFELERKAREEIRSIKGIKAKAKLIDSNEAVRTQALLTQGENR